MGVIAGIFLLSYVVFYASALSLLETPEAEIWEAWKSHVDKFHRGDVQFLQRADRYEAFHGTFNFVKRHNARYAAGKASYTVELNYRAAYLPHERTSGYFQPADSPHEDEATSRRILSRGGSGHCCGGGQSKGRAEKRPASAWKRLLGWRRRGRGKCSQSDCSDADCEKGCTHSTATGLVPPPLDSAFNVPSNAQAVQFQYQSIPDDSLAGDVDWRSSVNEVQDQGLCGNCWAYVVAQAIEAATAIATGSLPKLSTQQLTDCSSGSTGGPGKGCEGGFPDKAMEWVALRRSDGIATNESYPNIKNDQACQGDGEFGASISGYGYVPAYNEIALQQALQTQPVIVNIKADYSFQTYSGGILDDVECGNEVNHAVLVVGYGTDKETNKTYWIIMNSWGNTWGEDGFIRVAFSYEDPPGGICGLYVNRPIYPIVKPQSDPCALNPCGGGLCLPVSPSQSNYTCSHCPLNFPVQLNPDGSQTCAVNPCGNHVLNNNPCGFGACSFAPQPVFQSTNPRWFSYSCRCPSGTVLGSFSSGSPKCTSGSRTYTVLASDLRSRYPCLSIAKRFSLMFATFLDLNDGLNCSALKVGQTLTVSRNVPDPGCTKTVLAKRGDTCKSLWTNATLTQAQFLNLNTNLDCNNPVPVGWQVCLAGKPTGMTAVACGQYKYYTRGTRCTRIAEMNSISTDLLLKLNPGINCPLQAAVGRNVCVAPLRSTRGVRCGKYWTVQAGNTCWQIWTTYDLTEAQFKDLNPGVMCDYLEVGTHVCVQAYEDEDS